MTKAHAYLVIGWLGSITSFAIDAKNIFAAGAAFLSLIASGYAVALARHELRKREREDEKSDNTKPPIFPALVLFAVIMGIGCAPGAFTHGIKKAAQLPGKVLNAVAVAVTTTTTNVTEQAIVTARDIVTQDPATLLFVTNTTYQTNFTLVTNISAIARPAATSAVQTGQAAGVLLPPPWGEAAAGAFTLLSGGLAWAVRRRNAMLKAVIQGVEVAPPDASKIVKQSIDAVSYARGIAEEMRATVKKHT